MITLLHVPPRSSHKAPIATLCPTPHDTPLPPMATAFPPAGVGQLSYLSPGNLSCGHLRSASTGKLAVPAPQSIPLGHPPSHPSPPPPHPPHQNNHHIPTDTRSPPHRPLPGVPPRRSSSPRRLPGVPVTHPIHRPPSLTRQFTLGAIVRHPPSPSPHPHHRNLTTKNLSPPPLPYPAFPRPDPSQGGPWLLPSCLPSPRPSPLAFHIGSHVSTPSGHHDLPGVEIRPSAPPSALGGGTGCKHPTLTDRKSPRDNDTGDSTHPAPA